MTRKNMTVRQLVDQLLEQAEAHEDGDEAEVRFSYNYGDHCRTMVAQVPTSVELLEVEHSSYHDMDRLADQEDEIADELEDLRFDLKEANDTLAQGDLSEEARANVAGEIKVLERSIKRAEAEQAKRKQVIVIQ